MLDRTIEDWDTIFVSIKIIIKYLNLHFEIIFFSYLFLEQVSNKKLKPITF